MKCPKCNKPKTKDDFYYRKGCGWKISPDCKTCIAQRWKDKKEVKQPSGLFNINEFAKFYNY